jgi:hypothetical protein
MRCYRRAQRTAVANLAVFGWVPIWVWTARHRLRRLPQDDRDREALISGLEVLAGVVIGKEAA